MGAATTLLTSRVRETFCRLPFNFHGRWLVAFAFGHSREPGVALAPAAVALLLRDDNGRVVCIAAAM